MASYLVRLRLDFFKLALLSRKTQEELVALSARPGLLVETDMIGVFAQSLSTMQEGQNVEERGWTVEDRVEVD